MKRILFTCFAVLLLSTANAQGWDEWFNQKNTQKKYLVQQIAALKVYVNAARKGYNAAKKGLRSVGNFNGGEYGLHQAYFHSLKTVNPALKSNTRLRRISELYESILINCIRSHSDLQKSKEFSAAEMDYIGRVLERLLSDCDRSMDELVMVVTDGSVQMTDDQRALRVEEIYAEMQRCYLFLQGFSNDAKLLALQRKGARQHIQRSGILHGIKLK